MKLADAAFIFGVLFALTLLSGCNGDGIPDTPAGDCVRVCKAQGKVVHKYLNHDGCYCEYGKDCK